MTLIMRSPFWSPRRLTGWEHCWATYLGDLVMLCNKSHGWSQVENLMKVKVGSDISRWSCKLLPTPGRWWRQSSPTCIDVLLMQIIRSCVSTTISIRTNQSRNNHHHLYHLPRCYQCHQLILQPSTSTTSAKQPVSQFPITFSKSSLGPIPEWEHITFSALHLIILVINSISVRWVGVKYHHSNS